MFTITPSRPFLLYGICHEMNDDFGRQVSNYVPCSWDISVAYIKLQVKPAQMLKNILSNIKCYEWLFSGITPFAYIKSMLVFQIMIICIFNVSLNSCFPDLDRIQLWIKI